MEDKIEFISKPLIMTPVYNPEKHVIMKIDTSLPKYVDNTTWWENFWGVTWMVLRFLWFVFCVGMCIYLPILIWQIIEHTYL